MRQRWLLVLLLCGVLVTGCSPDRLTGFRPNPQPAQSTPSPPEVSTVPTVLILDGSGSMIQADAPGPRIDAAKNAARGLIDALPDQSTLALQTYGTATGSAPGDREAGCRDVSILLSLRPLERESMATAIDSITPAGYTPISLALRVAADQLPPDSSPQAIVLVSDGEDTCDTPPCDTATELKKSRPGLTISTVGFKVDGPAADQLRCVAEATGGIYVQAANADQLAARLLATQNIDQANTSLSSTGLGGVDLGSAIGDIRAEHPDFPEATTTGSVTVIWRDCDFTFTDGILDSIAPHDGGRTIDGVRVGDPVERAAKLYGKPLAATKNSDGTTSVIFSADPNTDHAYRTTVSDFEEVNGTVIGTITKLILCRCKPQALLPDSPPPSSECTGRVLSHTDIRNSEFGEARVFLSGAEASTGIGCIRTVLASGKTLPPIAVTVYDDNLRFADPATDSTGNTFVVYNPGRYDGVVVLVPEADGFESIDWDHEDTHYTGKRAYYYAQLEGPGPDGAYSIIQMANDCDPDCAGGTITQQALHWNGSDYVP